VTVLLVAVGAAVGAPLRYLVDRAVQARHDSVFPWGTLAVNVAGSALLGLLAGLDVPGEAMAALGTGFCGALTTYSTFGYETVRLVRDGARAYAAANALVSVGAGLAAGGAGLAVGSLLG
jgi:CrcB protein